MRSAFWALFVVVVIIAGWWLWDTNSRSGGEDTNNEAGMPNPAAVYCLDQGGTLETKSDADGESTFCIFPDGIACEEWSFFRGESCQDKVTADTTVPQPTTITTGVDEEAIGGDEPWENPLDFDRLPF